MSTASAELRGRGTSISALRGALDAAIGGRGRLVLVTGEAGIGKSTLAAAIAADAEARGVAVTWGRAWEFADAPPYFPVWPCLRALGLPTSDDGEPFQLWEQVLARVSAAAPAVWLIEDLHAADLATLDLLAYLVQPLRATRLLVIATARGHDPRLTDRMTQRLARMARDGLDVRLEPLDAGDVAALTADILGRAIPAAALPKMVELTGGNPLFVVECARAFRAAGGVEGTLEALPPTIRQVVLERFAQLPAATRDALSAGAIVGREPAAATVARMLETLPATVIDALLPALRAGVVRETRPGQFLFSHTLVRDAVEDALSPQRRAELHARASDALAGDTSDAMVERARHALSALSGAAIAADAAQLLADRATALLEREGAFDRAFELHVRVAEARRAGLLPPAAGERTLHAARTARAAGRSEACRRWCDEVITAARASGNAELLARAALLHAADIRPGVIDRAQVALLEEARTLLADRDAGLAARLLARHAVALQPAPDPRVVAAMTREALDLARATGDDATLLDVLELAGWGFVGEPPDVLLAWARELRDRAEAAGDTLRELFADTWLSFLLYGAGEFAAANAIVDRVLALAAMLGHPQHRWRALLIASGRAVVYGHFAESDRYVAEVEQLAPVVDDPALPLSLLMHEIHRARLQRRDDRVRALLVDLDRGLATVIHATAMAATIRAACAARRNDVDEARAQMAIVGSTPQRTAPPAIIAETWACAASDADRRAMRAELAAAPITMNGSVLSFVDEGPTARLIGLLDLALGEHAAAERNLRAALAIATTNDAKPWIAQISTELARIVGGDEARRLRDSALAIARQIGMPGIEAELAHAPVAATAAALELAREGEVWRIARGDRTCRVKDSRGVQLLARLVERPHEEIHVLALASDDGASVPESSAGPAIDERAKREYQRRLVDLDDQLARAEDAGDARAAARIEREKTAIVGELARATGLGGRARQTASATERARINVQKRLKDAIVRVAEVDATLGQFLDGAIQTGTFCCYRPPS